MEFSGYLIKDSVHSLLRKSMARISTEFLLSNDEVMILIEFPELAVKDVEMLVREICTNFIDIFFSIDMLESLEEVTVFEFSSGDFSVIISINSIEDSLNNCISISLLEFGSCFQEL